ncbi:single-stranded-DNA-specific exonuclease RecJ [Mucisphaera calidilacus]|uniref:Single-stranded-DNA-specific exonuclease RecJ n=1 Tax=Mucisphaera calidilacus TaxID=2527982 RepID=A0A518BTL6_9BACT|nr:single-stranded-DNA-specific exonuclease RecJ [Mucisphaera calidilacus]QDU70316.1 Single-stranded-DNA-specific exonuclease RecJ [Mucisphaera calidilacus]
MAIATMDARKRWRFRTESLNGAEQGMDALVRDTGLDPMILRLLARRGQHTPEQIDRFLNPRLTDLHDPDLLPGAVDAARRLSSAIRDRRPIIIYGDYDVDGVTASAILWHTLKAFDADVRTYIPHRIDEGYGINTEALLGLIEGCDRPPVIISVDCGITAVEPAQAAVEAGAELIITDHHGFEGDALPQAHVLVHPGLEREEGGAYPWRDLCGAGVAFKVAWALAREHTGQPRLDTELRALLLDLVSLAALGTVADVVPLLDENRVIASIGLRQIKRTRFVGLNAMIKAAKLESERVSAHHVGFVLGPRLNACGRMGHAGEALRLLTDATEEEAEAIAAELTRVNNERRSTERRIADAAKQLVEEEGWDAPDRRALVVVGEDWHPGVLGIVASRLVDAFSRPSIVLSLNGEGIASGSARSVDGVSILDGLTSCSDCFTRFGGHAMAAGMTLPGDRVDELRERLVAFVNERLSPDELRPVLKLEEKLDLGSCTEAVCKQIERLAPFGRGNPAPCWTFEGLTIEDEPRVMGRGGAHLALRVADREADRRIRMVGWRLGSLAEQLATGVRVDVAGVPRHSVWQGMSRVEIEISDLRVCEAV